MAIGTQSVSEICERAKRASHQLATLDTATKNGALEAIARELEARVDEILEANAADIDDGRAAGLDAALIEPPARGRTAGRSSALAPLTRRSSVAE